MSPSARNAAWLVLAASVAFATSGPAGRVALEEWPAAAVAGARCAIAGLVLLLVTRGEIARVWAGLPRRARVLCLGAGVVLAVHFALFTAGLGATSFPAAVTLVSLEPVAVLVAATLFFRARPTRAEWLGVGIAVAGAALLAGAGGDSGGHRVSGDLMVLGAVLLYGLYYAAARAIAGQVASLPFASVVYLVAAATLAATVALGPGPAPIAPGARTVVAVLVLGLVPTLVGHTLVQIASRRVTASLVALVSPGESLGSVLIGAALLGLPPSPRELACGAAILLGVTVVALGVRRSPPPPSA